MLGNLLLALRHALPDFPGRQRLLGCCDRALGPFAAKTKSGVRLRVFASSFMDAHYFDPRHRKESDATILAQEIARLGEGDVFIDVGANIGYYSILAARRVGASGLVLAFEPSQREFVRLLENLALNACRNAVPVSVALGSVPAIAELHIAPTHTGLNTLRVSSAAVHAFHGATTQRVLVPRFDDLVAPLLGGRRVRLLKIDVEGAEMDVLLGMQEALRQRLFERIVVEITPRFLENFGQSKEALYALLEGCGYVPRFRSPEWQYDEVFDAPAPAAQPLAAVSPGTFPVS